MMLYSEALTRLINEFKKMPGIGQKSAQRLAFYVLRISKAEAQKLARAIVELKERIRHCSICGNITEVDPCPICRDESRDQATICVVEEPHDLLAIERTKTYRGSYHVLMGVISPLDDVGPESIRIQELIERVRRGGIKEVIVATGPTVEGEATAMYIAKQLKEFPVKVSRIARGLPMGGDLEYADEVTIAKSLEGRMEM